jgi:hypothetical protein
MILVVDFLKLRFCNLHTGVYLLVLALSGGLYGPINRIIMEKSLTSAIAFWILKG